jgi:2-oxoglutarate dehydrogenase E1 component
MASKINMPEFEASVEVKSEKVDELTKSSLLSGGSSEYLDLLYEQYLDSPTSVPANWRQYFDNLEKSNNKLDIAHQPIKEYFKQLAKNSNNAHIGGTQGNSSGANNRAQQQNIDYLTYLKKQDAVNKLIVAYRRFGHCHANIDPLNLTPQDELPNLTLEYYNFTKDDLDTKFTADGLLATAEAEISLKDILTVLQKIYCGPIGYQYQYITDHEELVWLQERIEKNHGSYGKNGFTAAVKKNILNQLTAAEGLEQYLGTRFVAQKRFSLEGGESLIVIMDELIQRSGDLGFQEIVVAMAHRGRLNVLINTLGKEPAELFAEFEGKPKSNSANVMSGDVKYHLGFSSDVKTPGGEVHLSLAFNPSHLEIVAPVAQGSVKARQDRCCDLNNNKVLLLSLHGDSAFAGQGVVMETMNMSQLRGFSIGGTVHVVINNQVGFTTNDCRDTRSTRYCTDLAKMIEVPVFHVNGDDPEAVLWVTQLAIDYRYKFNKDVVIDLVCYRRHGHNEADEPSGTQPIMYKVIKNLETTRDLYAKKLIAENIISQQQDQEAVDLYRKKLDQGSTVVDNIINQKNNTKNTKISEWAPYVAKHNLNNLSQHTALFDSGYDKTKLLGLGKKITSIPDGFILQTQVKKVIETRAKMATGEMPMDWGCAEMLAYASLIEQGYSLRLCGQDSGRGTFAHRHAVLHDQVTGDCYNPLDKVNSTLEMGRAQCTVIDSFLSEEAVLAFEYGYSTTDPKTLTIWEAQFGDFVNGAQVVIDQFISSCEQKWGRLSGLVLLLPHGYEGSGPEHSSARLERFLQLCAEHNMQVCVPTTPSQVFHMLRRQMLSEYRKPLVVMSPKAILRYKLAVSSIDELTTGSFNLVIPEINQSIINTKAKVKRVILCSGKVYYDLLEEREKNNITDIVIIRIEQLYPFPEQELAVLLAEYKHAKEVIWCQEEPKNQGAWYCSSHHMHACLSSWQVLEYVGRESSSAPAVGYAKLHAVQQSNLVKQALNTIDKK